MHRFFCVPHDMPQCITEPGQSSIPVTCVNQLCIAFEFDIDRPYPESYDYPQLTSQAIFLRFILPCVQTFIVAQTQYGLEQSAQLGTLHAYACYQPSLDDKSRPSTWSTSKQKRKCIKIHTTAGIRWSSPTQLLIGQSPA
jgi:hypothetical protein